MILRSIKTRLISSILYASSVALMSQDDTIDFNCDVRPILTKNCTTCHGGVKKAGNVIKPSRIVKDIML